MYDAYIGVCGMVYVGGGVCVGVCRCVGGGVYVGVWCVCGCIG